MLFESPVSNTMCHLIHEAFLHACNHTVRTLEHYFQNVESQRWSPHADDPGCQLCEGRQDSTETSPDQTQPPPNQMVQTRTLPRPTQWAAGYGTSPISDKSEETSLFIEEAEEDVKDEKIEEDELEAGDDDDDDYSEWCSSPKSPSSIVRAAQQIQSEALFRCGRGQLAKARGYRPRKAGEVLGPARQGHAAHYGKPGQANIQRHNHVWRDDLFRFRSAGFK
ncbi:Uu.00g053100.m01.CDS01 [Anthostomella pinea]|uniref:Uu.00g053100.m01.CDS01 n=1 Tax=Anthostomella pinea TaxID=933095 RepID=A0AAI8VWZ7_9PEZI|nr:Uu.00g053100.m01.CDS01 [Anthostomella pinea]